MIKKDELLRAHKEFGLPLPTVEKDYVLGLLIWGIASHPLLGRSWIFKGGTALKKCFFGDYRFSEDLDYTLTAEASTDPSAIIAALTEVFDNIYGHCGLKIQAKDISVIPFPDKNGLVLQIKVPYQGPLLSSGSLPRIKLDLSADEIIADQPDARVLLHQYSDSNGLETRVLCYSIYEIFAEKLRAFTERTRPRDLYDIVHLHRYFLEHDYDKQYLQRIATIKFRHKGLSFPAALQLVNSAAMHEAKTDWDNMLSYQVPNLKPLEDFLVEANNVVGWISATTQIAQTGHSLSLETSNLPLAKTSKPTLYSNIDQINADIKGNKFHIIIFDYCLDYEARKRSSEPLKDILPPLSEKVIFDEYFSQISTNQISGTALLYQYSDGSCAGILHDAFQKLKHDGKLKASPKGEWVYELTEESKKQL